MSISKFPFLLSIFLFIISFSTFVNAQATQDQEERVYIKIEIKGLACPYCAFGMEKELKKISGVKNVDIELKTGMAYISTPHGQEPTEENLKQIIVDAGFTAGEIEYSSHTFTEKE